MKDLSIFFPEHIKKRETGFALKVSERFLDEKGEPIFWEFEHPSHEKFKEIKESGQRQTMENNKLVFKADIDNMSKTAITECVVYPDLKNAALQDAYGAVDEKTLLEEMLYPDELERLGQKLVIKIGLIEDPMSLLDDAKN